MVNVTLIYTKANHGECTASMYEGLTMDGECATHVGNVRVQRLSMVNVPLSCTRADYGDCATHVYKG